MAKHEGHRKKIRKLEWIRIKERASANGSQSDMMERKVSKMSEVLVKSSKVL